MTKRGSNAQIRVDVADEREPSWGPGDPDDTRPTAHFPVARPSPQDGEDLDVVFPVGALSSGEVMVVPEPESLRDLETFHAIESADTVSEGEVSGPGQSGVVAAGDEESRLRVTGRWEELLELYLKKLEATDAPKAKAELFRRIAEVFDGRLGDPDQAIDALVEALSLDPFDHDTSDALESIARRVGKWSPLVVAVDDAMKKCADRERQAKLCDHLVRWYTVEKGSPELAEQYKDRIRKLDPKHPLVQLELAAGYKDQGSYPLARDALTRALDGLRRKERVPVHIALGDLYEFYLGDVAEAQKAYEAALAIVPGALDALGGLERIYRAQEKYRELEGVLERQGHAEDATSEDRAQALMRLALLQEKHFLKYDAAARTLAEVLELDGRRDEALEALERCEIAMRAWSDVIRTLDRRATLARDPAQRAAVLARMAEVQESKLCDLEAASATYEQMASADPNGAAAPTELARLAEKRQDWGASAAYRARLAQLAPDAAQATQMLMQIGDMLAQPGRDADSARHYYERALAITPGHLGAWDALQKDAERTQDAARVVYCLEQRANLTDAPRAKAQLLVELARAKKELGSESGAFSAYQDAVTADPSNEIAAAAVLPTLANQSRWPEAAPLCELLVNAATRDGDHERAFDLLRLASRIATKMDNLERAVMAALAAHELDRRAPEGQRDLLVVCEMAKDRPAVLERARDAIVEIGDGADALPAASLVHLAAVERALGGEERARDTLARALAKEPNNVQALGAASELYAARGDFEHAAAFKKRLAEAAADDGARYALLVEAGETWTHRAKNLPMAALAFEDALAIKPRDSWLLHTLLWVYGELSCWEKLVETLRAVVEIDRDTVKKAKGLFTMAQVMRDKIGDAYRAAELFEETIAVDPTRLDAFERVVRIYTELKDWAALEKSYRRMIHRTGDDEVELRHALFHQLGLIYRDRIGNADGALDAFRAAGTLKPSDENRRIISELYVVAGRIDDAIRETRAALQSEPSSVALYTQLYELFLRARTFDKAWCTVNVLAHLGPLSAEQRKFHDDYPPVALSYVPGMITPAAWRSHLLHPELDPTLTAIFSVMAAATMRAREALIAPAQRAAAFGEPMRPDHSYNAGTLLDAVTHAAAILSVPVPSVFARRGPPQPLAIAPSAVPGLVSSVDALDSLSHEALSFLVGKRLAELRPELIGRALFPTVSEMTTALATAVRIVRGEASPDPATTRADRELGALMTPEERVTLQGGVLRATMAGSKLDVKQWSRLADLSSSRVGLLLCGHIEYARRAMLQDGQNACDLPPRARVQQMCLFAIGDPFAELRAAIGVDVAGA